ncbi:transcription regulator protein BACH1b [Lepisosteus oculatus]|uniref:transcription regulator protein BACH1b n=1 Tax=Lepisosteus oculatus TaxID=7918 RepID=UPI0037217298
MTFESIRTSTFSYQSSIHSSHVLLCLNEQRQKGILCDVTVVVEDKSFQAHRSVLAACSDYFRSRVTSRHDHVITLPKEVTVEGFDPLLQFAYTAKLLFTKENVLEIRNCAEVLGFHNLDKACFDFVVPKFFESGRNTQRSPRKLCCRSRCWKEKLLAAESVNIDDVGEDALDTESPDTGTLKKKSDTVQCPELQAEMPGGCSPNCSERSTQAGFSSLCPKYRKFQIACGKDRFCLENCGQEIQQFFLSAAPETFSPSSQPCGAGDNRKENPLGNVTGQSDLEMEEHHDNGTSETDKCHPCGQQVLETLCAAGTSTPCCSRSLALSSPASSGLRPDPLEMCGVLEDRALEDGGEEQAIKAGLPDPVLPGLVLKDQPGPGESGERSSVEREVAEHLAKGFWSELCPPPAEGLDGDRGPSQQATSEGTTEFRWLSMNINKSYEQLDLTASTADCPFLRDLDTQDCCDLTEEQIECGVVSQPEKSPYISSINSGDDSDFDTEGDSESFTRERAREVALPFSVEEIASLSRNDFQQMLKYHKLTREQLDFVHDVRRRSKNRIAAQRCRKRKLDCIQNLESEIDKLKTEKEKLLEEKQQLKMRMGETRQDLSKLYQRLCSEAALTQDQLQVFAKYSSPNCPLSSLLASSGSPACPELGPLLSSLAGDSCGTELTGEPEGESAPRTADPPSTEHCCQSVISDFCLEMTSKCTTE